MKKKVLVTAILTLAVGAVGITACSKKADTAATTAAEASVETTAEADSVAASESDAESDAEDEIEEEYMSGLITAIDGDVLTVKNDEDETEKAYDISKAELTQEYPFAEGDWIEICYPAETTEDPIPAMTVEVLDSVIAQNTDPSEEGKIVEVTEDTVTIEVEGENYTLNTANAYIVSANGIAADQNAIVTYIGDLDDEAMAVKIVTEDSYESDEAKINALIGEVAQIGDEGESIVLESAQGDFFTFVSDEIDFSEYAEGDTLQIEYTGTVTAKTIPAVEVIKK